MDWAYLTLITVIAVLLFMMVQRAEAKRRRMVAGLVFLALLLVRQNAFIKGDLHEETLLAFGLGITRQYHVLAYGRQIQSGRKQR